MNKFSTWAEETAVRLQEVDSGEKTLHTTSGKEYKFS